MQVTSNYYRCRAQSVASLSESLSLPREVSTNEKLNANASLKGAPLRPSPQTLLGLESLHKSDSQTHVA